MSVFDCLFDGAGGEKKSKPQLVCFYLPGMFVAADEKLPPLRGELIYEGCKWRVKQIVVLVLRDNNSIVIFILSLLVAHCSWEKNCT